MGHLEKVFNIKNKLIIITGAASGNGKAIALGLSKLKCKLLICDKDSIKLNKIFNLIKKYNPKNQKFSFDLSNTNEINNFIKYIKKNKLKVDVLINNAGVSFPSNIIEYPIELWNETLNVNLRAPFLLSTRIAKLMKNSNSSSIINITSLASYQGFPNNISYVASKGALKQMTKSLAYDLSKYNIRVNNICPGYIKTNMTNQSFKNSKLSKDRINNTLLKRWGKSEDLLGAIIYLSSDASNYVTGSEIVIDGGWLAKGL